MRRIHSWDVLKEATIWDLLGNNNMRADWVTYRGVHAVRLGSRVFVWAGVMGHWTTPPHNRVINDPCGISPRELAEELFESVMGGFDPSVDLQVRLKWISG
jgi:hypothetical protein